MSNNLGPLIIYLNHALFCDYVFSVLQSKFFFYNPHASLKAVCRCLLTMAGKRQDQEFLVRCVATFFRSSSGSHSARIPRRMMALYWTRCCFTRGGPCTDQRYISQTTTMLSLWDAAFMHSSSEYPLESIKL